MARKNSKGRKGARPLAAAAFVNITRTARKALAARIDDARHLALGAASGAREAATRLEKVFEERVSRAVSSLGIPTSDDVRALSHQVAELQASVERLKRSRARA